MSTPLQVDVATGLLPAARWRPSPYSDERPPGTDIDLLVVHGISLPPGEFGGPAIEQLFLGALPFDAHPYYAGLRALRVSAHFLIRRDGELLQFVACGRRAWHAGVSRFEGRGACNDFSIGVELEGTDDTIYTAAQYRCLVALSRSLMRAYPGITPERIVGHSDVAPGRKTDPGPAFDWAGFRRALASSTGAGLTTTP